MYIRERNNIEYWKWIIAAMDVIFIAVVIFAKSSYYFSLYDKQFFSTAIEAVVWAAVSISISVSPAVIQIFFLLNKRIEECLAWLFPLGLCVINLILECISLLGGGSSLNEAWINMAIKMIKIQALMLIPILAAAIFITTENRKQQKRQGNNISNERAKM